MMIKDDVVKGGVITCFFEHVFRVRYPTFTISFHFVGYFVFRDNKPSGFVGISLTPTSLIVPNNNKMVVESRKTQGVCAMSQCSFTKKALWK
jgi:hypothetical protein